MSKYPPSTDIVQRIKTQIPILDYLKESGYTPVKSGTHYWRLKESSSFVYDDAKDRFYWNAHGYEGSIIDLCAALEGVSDKKAISLLSKRIDDAFPQPSATPRRTCKARKEPAAPSPFVLPPHNPQAMRCLYGYLTKTRAIEPAVVRWLVKQGIVYPSVNSNMCYWSPGYDGKPSYAALKSTWDQSSFRQVVAGANCKERFSVNLVNRKARMLVVCEAAVDLFSVMSYFYCTGWDFTKYAYLSLECCCESPLIQHLQHNPQIEKVVLAQDHDDGGMSSRKWCLAALEKMNYTGQIADVCPTAPKDDWNDEWKKRRKLYVRKSLQPSA